MEIKPWYKSKIIITNGAALIGGSIDFIHALLLTNAVTVFCEKRGAVLAAVSLINILLRCGSSSKITARRQK